MNPALLALLQQLLQFLQQSPGLLDSLGVSFDPLQSVVGQPAPQLGGPQDANVLTAPPGQFRQPKRKLRQFSPAEPPQPSLPPHLTRPKVDVPPFGLPAGQPPTGSNIPGLLAGLPGRPRFPKGMAGSNFLMRY